MHIDPNIFRQVLAHYPTGVCIITAREEGGQPIGMIVGTFTSVSLDPPLVGFLPDRRSTTWPRVERAGLFCVNILADDHEQICRAFFAKDVDRFSGMSSCSSPAGLPILDDVLAWIECDLDAVHPVGDHFFVTGAVRELNVERDDGPLLFVKGSYCSVARMACSPSATVSPN